MKGRERRRVVFLPDGKGVLVERGTSLLEAAREAGVAVESVCGGKASCGRCRVRVEASAFRRPGMESKRSSLSPVTGEELELLGREEMARGGRLACSARVRGDVVVTVPGRGRQVVRKGAGKLKVEIDPAVRSYVVEPKRPEPGGKGDLERLFEALELGHGLKGLGIDLSVLRGLPGALRKDEQVTVAVWQGREIIRVAPGKRGRAFGLAVDIGTTTLAGCLTDLQTGEVVASDSGMNPQIAFGEDVLSRITYAMMHREGAERLRASVLEALNKILKNVAKDAGIRTDDILDIAVVGNTCMHHLFLGLDPRGLGVAPFSPAALGSIDARAGELGLDAGEGTKVHALPLKAGFVGADCIGAVLATGIHASKEATLLLDIGTNGEIVLGDRRGLLCASCATGPVFEGAHITHGMRATHGAIERVEIDPEPLEVEVEVIGGAGARPRGICGSGVISAVSELLKAGVIDPRGMLGRGQKGRFVLVNEKRSGTGDEIAVSQEDIKAVQLAKAALHAGCRVLAERCGRAPERVLLAGAFGSSMDPRAALRIGMFPDCDPRAVKVVGNAAGDGARLALLDRKKRKEAEELAGRMEYLELTVAPEFQKEFVRALPFPARRRKG